MRHGVAGFFVTLTRRPDASNRLGRRRAGRSSRLPHCAAAGTRLAAGRLRAHAKARRAWPQGLLLVDSSLQGPRVPRRDPVRARQSRRRHPRPASLRRYLAGPKATAWSSPRRCCRRSRTSRRSWRLHSAREWPARHHFTIAPELGARGACTGERGGRMLRRKLVRFPRCLRRFDLPASTRCATVPTTVSRQGLVCHGRPKSRRAAMEGVLFCEAVRQGSRAVFVVVVSRKPDRGRASAVAGEGV
jgi:hypothetical protein